jgi:hypothetical protein
MENSVKMYNFCVSSDHVLNRNVYWMTFLEHFLNGDVSRLIVCLGIGVPIVVKASRAVGLPPAFTLVSCLAYSLTPKVEAAYFFEMSVDFHQARRHYIPEDRTLLCLLYVIFLCFLSHLFRNLFMFLLIFWLSLLHQTVEECSLPNTITPKCNFFGFSPLHDFIN